MFENFPLKKGWQNIILCSFQVTVTCQWAVSYRALTTRNISSYIGCPNNTLSLSMTLETYLYILLYIRLNLQILSSFCCYVASHSVSNRYVPHTAKAVTMNLSRCTYFPIGIAAYTFLYRNLSLRFVKLSSKKFLISLSAFIMKLWHHIFT